VGQVNIFYRFEWLADTLFFGGGVVFYTIKSMAMTGGITCMKSIFTLIMFMAAMVSKDTVSMMVMGNNVMAKVSK
jgi:hypothetical protein